MPIDLTIPREYKRRAEAVLPGRVARVILYGSRARGDAHDESDWDIAVFLKGHVGADERDALSDVGASVLLDTGAVIQTAAFPEDRLSDPGAFLESIRSQGIPL